MSVADLHIRLMSEAAENPMKITIARTCAANRNTAVVQDAAHHGLIHLHGLDLVYVHFVSSVPDPASLLDHSAVCHSDLGSDLLDPTAAEHHERGNSA